LRTMTIDKRRVNTVRLFDHSRDPFATLIHPFFQRKVHGISMNMASHMGNTDQAVPNPCGKLGQKRAKVL
jgi:hypothetical protein